MKWITLQSEGLGSDMNPSSGSNGYEAPLSDPEQDALGRRELIHTLYDAIRTTPLSWSVRCALFGAWGEGKTSVARMMCSIAASDGFLTADIPAWRIRSADALVTLVFQHVLEQLDSEQKGNVGTRTLRGRIYARALSAGIPGDLLMKEVTGGDSEYRRALRRARQIAHQTILSLGRSEWQPIAEVLGDKRVVIVVDDVDRCSDEVIPELLLAMKEMLDWPLLSFIVPFDERKVRDAVETRMNPTLSSQQFIDKVFEFQMTLPQVPQETGTAFLQEEIRHEGLSIPEHAVQSVKPVLPRDPRALKALIRHCRMLEALHARHEEDEFPWEYVLPLLLLRLEIRSAFDAAIEHLLDTGHAPDWYADAFGEEIHENDNENEEPRAVRKFRDVLNGQALSEGSQDIALQLLAHLQGQSHGLLFADWRFRYAVDVLRSPHAVTWREYRALRGQSPSTLSRQYLSNWAERQAKVSRKSSEEILSEIHDKAFEEWDLDLNNAANQALLADTESWVQRAKEVSNLVRTLLFDDDGSLRRMDDRDPVESFAALWRIHSSWVHFQANDCDSLMRRRESTLLERLGASLEDSPWRILDVLDPFDASHSSTTESRRAVADACRRLALAHLDRASKELLDRFSSDDAFFGSVSEQEAKLVHGLFFEITSETHRRHRTAILRLLEKPTRAERVNARGVLIRVTRDRGGQRYGLTPDECDAYKRDHELVERLWAAAVAEPLQFRALQGTREIHRSLIDAGVPEDRLPIPPWLCERTMT